MKYTMSSPLPPDPYAALGLSSDADLATIRTAHRKLVLKVHPDRIRDETQREKSRIEFQKVQLAYELLSDTSRRSRYDDQVKLAELRKERGMMTGDRPKESSYATKGATASATPRRDRPGLYEERAPPSTYFAEYDPWNFPGGRSAERSNPEEKMTSRPREPVAGDGRTASPRVQQTSTMPFTAATVKSMTRKAEEAREKARESRKNQEMRDREMRRERSEKQTTRYRAHVSDESSSESDTARYVRRREPRQDSSSLKDSYKPKTRSPEELQIEKEIKERNKLAAQRRRRQKHDLVDDDQVDGKSVLDRETSVSDPPQKQQSREKLWTVPVEQLGLVSMAPEASEDVKVDIVAVHGLGAIPDITWKEKHSGVNWLSDKNMLPKLVPQARIMRFGYDSLWMGKTPIRASLSTIAYKLLLSLNIKRGECIDRPLIFIGHCFGGLVIERALNLAKMQVKAYPGVCESAVGTVFLGTPHRGTLAFTRDSALLAAIAKSSDLGEGIEMGLLDAMASEDGTLLDVADDFVSFCRESRLLITCFFEQRTSTLGKVIGQDDIKTFIVDASSATLDGQMKYGLELDHFSLNKFPSPDNPHYRAVSKEIERFYYVALQRANAMLNTQADGGKPPNTSSRPAVTEDDKWKSLAAQQIYEEEIKRRASVQDLNLRKNFEREKKAAKAAAEKLYLDRLLKNLRKYEVKDAETLIKTNPLPDDKDLSDQAILEKDRWFKNNLKGILEDLGLDDGIIDEILNDTGPTMIIDGVESTYTRLSSKWISKRTLDRYEIPWMKDKNDESTFIVKRWVPDYELTFLWDHSRKLRGGRGRKAWKEPASSSKPPELSRTNTMPVERERPAGSKVKYKVVTAQEQNSYFSPPKRERASGYNSSSETYWRGEQDLTRSRSNDSVRSAPGYEEVARRRRDSRTLSGSQTPTSPGLQRQQSNDSAGPKQSSREPNRISTAKWHHASAAVYRSDDEFSRNRSPPRRWYDVGSKR